jgi:hypothetical protein
MGKHFGRTSNAGRNFLGNTKAPRLGLGKHDGLGKGKQAQPPQSAFDRSELAAAAK